MESEFKANTSWQPLADAEDKINMDLDLTLERVFETNDPAAELQQRGGVMKELIFNHVLHRVIPQIIDGTNIPIEYPQDGLRTTDEMNVAGHCSCEQSPEGIVIGNQMKIDITLKSDTPVHSIVALHKARANLAGAITENIMHNLGNIYLGVTDSEFKRRTRVRERRTEPGRVLH